MKKQIQLFALAFLPLMAQAQTFYNNGATLLVNTNCIVQVNGNLTNAAGSSLTNDGNVIVTGTATNNQTMTVPNNGTLKFEGSAAQSLNGSAAFFAKDVVVNNAAGVTLNAPLKVAGSLTFTAGLINASTTSNAITFTSSGSHSGASDASHVNGFVVKEGTGNFTYPVGDASKYQKTDVNLSSNSAGMQVKYNAADAGSGSFTTTGTETTALSQYNSDEYWDISPIGSATGTVTLFWDAYKNSGSINVSDVKVAHKTGGNWLNEGTTGIGTSTAGSVTSNALSTWSPFSLGSVAVPLPIQFIYFTAKKTGPAQVKLNFEVNQALVGEKFEIQRSTDKNNWTKLGSIDNEINQTQYAFIDNNLPQMQVYYRIHWKQNAGKSLYSAIRIVSADGTTNNSNLTLFPNPAENQLQISGAENFNNLEILSTTGKVVLQKQFQTLNSYSLNVQNLPQGLYYLRLTTENGEQVVRSFLKN